MVKMGTKVIVKYVYLMSASSAKVGDVAKVVGRYNGNGVVVKNPNWLCGTLSLKVGEFEVIK